MSDKSVIQKLLIKEGYTVALVNAPRGYRTSLGALPKGVTVERGPAQGAEVIQLFVADCKELETPLPKM